MTRVRFSIISQIVLATPPPYQTASLCLRLVCSCGLWLVLAIAAPENARADSEYEDAIQRAVAAFNREDYEEATRQFERAHGRSPSARTLRGVGVSQFELGHYDRAAEGLNGALASNVAPLLGDMRRETERLLGEALARVGQVHLEVEPESSELAVDGTPKKLGNEQVLFLPPGPHTLEIGAPGYNRARHPITAETGRVFELKVKLVPLAQQAESSAHRRRWYKNPWLWTSVGLVVVAGAVVGGLALSGRFDKSDGSPDAGTSGFTVRLPALSKP